MKFYYYLIKRLFPVVIYSQTPSFQHKTNVPYENTPNPYLPGAW